MSNFKSIFIVVISILVIATLSIDYAYSRGGSSRAWKGGAGRSGSLSQNRAKKTAMQSGDHHGYYYQDDDEWARAFAAGTIIAPGTAVAVSAFQSTDCSSSQTMVGDYAYYQCGSTWYTKGYQSGDVVYIATTPPPGY